MFPLLHPLILASQSPRRDQILRMLGFEFAVKPADCDETLAPGASPAGAAEELARSKALKISRENPGALTLGADTLVELDGRILGKPATAAEALEMLRFLRGKTHRVFTGLALAHKGLVAAAGAECSEVDFASWEDRDLEAYIRTGEPMDKAGAYAVQGRGAFLVRGIRGCFFNVMGLPVQGTLDLLRPYRSA